MTAHRPRPGTTDPLSRRASEWLAGGPGERPVDLAFLGVPAWRTSLSMTQAHRTPAAVRAALSRMSTYSAFHDADLDHDVAPLDLGDVDDPDADENRTTDAARSAVAQSRLLVACGGDNSITYAVMRGAVDLGSAGLITLDAHHDMRDGVNNGSPVRRLIEAGLDPRRVVQIGISDFANSMAYNNRAIDMGIHVVRREELLYQAMADVMSEALDIAGSGGGGIYVDLDVDVCDRSVAPACPASLPGGLSAHELRAAAFAAGQDRRVTAIDITEVDAGADTDDQRTVRLAALCVLEAAAGLDGR